MPRLVTGKFINSKSVINDTFVTISNKGGFTLIELLIVILIISIAFTFSVLIFGDFGKSRQAQMTAEKIQHMLVFLREQAIIESIDIRTGFSSHGYKSQVIPSTHMIQHSSLPRFTSGVFPDGVLVRLYTEQSATANLNVYFQASGAMTPFKISFGTKARPDIIELIGSPNGKINLSAPHSS